MASLGGAFNANEHEEMQDFSPVPAGEYVVVMTDSEVKATRDGSSQGLNCKFEIIDGQFKGRILFRWLNLWHDGQAGEIARRELATIGRAVGVLSASDSAEFHNKPLLAKVTIQPPSKGKDGREYPASNGISNYSAVGGAATPFAPPAPPAQASSPAKPWERR